MSFSNVAARIFVLALLCALLASCRHEPPDFAFIDQCGRVRIRLQPGQEATSFSEGLAAVSRDGRWGYIDTSGAWVIPPQFGAARDFSEGLALVTNALPSEYSSKTAQFGFIDRTGKFVIAPRFNWAWSFSDGLAAVCTGPCQIPELGAARPSYGYINKDGDYVIEPKWEFAGPFSEGRAWVSERPVLVGGKLVDYQQPTERLIDRAGKFVSGARFQWGVRFSHGLAETDRGYVNRAGDVVIAWPLPGTEESFAEGWAGVTEGGRTVFIDTTGKVALRPDCQYANSFSEGLAAACKNDRGYENGWGYIDRTGKFVIPPQFHHSLGPFRNGLTLVCFGCKD
jgi:hypothetical protein